MSDQTNPILDYASPSDQHDERRRERAMRNRHAWMISSAIVFVGGLIAAECNTTHDATGMVVAIVGFVFLLIEFICSYR